jgi:UDP-N-acetylmuramoylalanine--D-glutamate ligase
VRMQDALRKALKAKKREDFNEIRLLNLREAMIAARTYAEKGDVVLLSPACASFEEFPNYKKRGEKFRKLVEKSA